MGGDPRNRFFDKHMVSVSTSLQTFSFLFDTTRKGQKQQQSGCRVPQWGSILHVWAWSLWWIDFCDNCKIQQFTPFSSATCSPQEIRLNVFLCVGFFLLKLNTVVEAVHSYQLRYAVSSPFSSKWVRFSVCFFLTRNTWHLFFRFLLSCLCFFFFDFPPTLSFSTVTWCDSSLFWKVWTKVSQITQLFSRRLFPDGDPVGPSPFVWWGVCKTQHKQTLQFFHSPLCFMMTFHNWDDNKQTKTNWNNNSKQQLVFVSKKRVLRSDIRMGVNKTVFARQDRNTSFLFSRESAVVSSMENPKIISRFDGFECCFLFPVFVFVFCFFELEICQFFGCSKTKERGLSQFVAQSVAQTQAEHSGGHQRTGCDWWGQHLLFFLFVCLFVITWFDSTTKKISFLFRFPLSLSMLFGLQMMAKELKISGPELALFDDPVFKYTCSWFLSTSSMPTNHVTGFGPVTQGGYGLYYCFPLHIDAFNYCVTSYYGDTRPTHLLVQCLDRALEDIKALLVFESAISKL